MVDVEKRTRRLEGAEHRLSRGHLEQGTVAGQYVITQLIGQGGGGAVYAAYHQTSRRVAAVKVLHRSLTVLPKMVERFRREVQVLNLLRHPSIVEVWEVGTLPDGQPFFAMERLAGKTVSKMLEQGGRMLPEETLEILEPACQALSAAHSAGVIHRDVKATNIMVLEGAPRRVKLLDFGVAKLSGPAFGQSTLTSEGQPIGTPASMAPEQILGGRVDARVDVYALGVLLYRMLTGRPPFLAHTALAQMRQHLEEPAPRPSLRAPAAAPLDPVVLRCMEKDPDRRYASVAELLSALRAAVSGAPAAPPDQPGTTDVGAAIYVEIRVRGGEDAMDLHLADHVGGLLDMTEDMLREADLLIAFATSNQVLAVRPLAGDAAAEMGRVVDVARVLRAELDRRTRAHDGVRANVCVHADEVVLGTSGAVEVLGGPLLCTDLWAPDEDVEPVCLTAGAARQLDGAGGTPPGVALLPQLDPDRTLHPRARLPGRPRP